MWSLDAAGKQKEAIHVKNELAAHITKNASNIGNRVKDFEANSLLKFHSKDVKIRKLELANQLSEETLKSQRIFIFFALLLLLLSIGLFYNYLAKLKLLKKLRKNESILKQQNEELVNRNEIINIQNVELEMNKVEIENELKSKLTLLSNNLDVLDKLEALIEGNQEIDFSVKRKLLNHLNSKENKRIIEDLDFQFLELHEAFYSKLSKKHPTLTSNNLKLCTYIKMNLSSKEIASLTFTSPNSVKIARSRLRKKLGLINPEQSIVSYLNSI